MVKTKMKCLVTTLTSFSRFLVYFEVKSGTCYTGLFIYTYIFIYLFIEMEFGSCSVLGWTSYEL